MSRIWEAIKQARWQRSQEDANATSPRRERGQERRAAFRHAHQAEILLYGLDADKQPFHEEVATIDANDNGCLLVSETVMTPGQRLFLTNTRNQAEQECRVVHVSGRLRGKVRVGVEFSQPAHHFWVPAGSH